MRTRPCSSNRNGRSEDRSDARKERQEARASHRPLPPLDMVRSWNSTGGSVHESLAKKLGITSSRGTPATKDDTGNESGELG